MFIYLIVIYAFDELHLVRQLSFEPANRSLIDRIGLAGCIGATAFQHCGRVFRSHVRKFERSTLRQTQREPAGESSFVRRVSRDRVAEQGSRRYERSLISRESSDRSRREASRADREAEEAGRGAGENRQVYLPFELRKWPRICSGKGTGCSLGSNATRTCSSSGMWSNSRAQGRTGIQTTSRLPH